MEVVIVTGMSGAGKSTVLKFLEDYNYFCIDNLPLSMILDVTKLYELNQEIDKIAIGIDIRGIRSKYDVDSVQSQVEKITHDTKLIFLDARDEVLIRRYKETRRTHPLGKMKPIQEAINEERVLISGLKDSANSILDTSTLLARELKKKLSQVVIGKEDFDNIIVNITTFGFKYGIPQDSDMIFDVRFLPNPYYDTDLRILTGNDEKVRDFVMDSDVSREFEEKLHNMIEFLIPQYINEGKNLLVISIGCTGGRHRSVTVANRLNDFIKKLGYPAFIKHNDIVTG